MKTVKHNSTFFTVVGIVAFLLYLLDCTGIMTLRIGTAHPVLLLPLLVAVAMVAREWVGLLFGAIFGILTDITAANSYCFNLVVMLIIGCACGLICSYLVNDNIYSALVLSLCSAVFYFTAKWVFFHLGLSGSDPFNYLLSYSLPSAAYSALFIIPFYYLTKLLSRKTNYIV